MCKQTIRFCSRQAHKRRFSSSVSERRIVAASSLAVRTDRGKLRMVLYFTDSCKQTVRRPAVCWIYCYIKRLHFTQELADTAPQRQAKFGRMRITTNSPRHYFKFTATFKLICFLTAFWLDGMYVVAWLLLVMVSLFCDDLKSKVKFHSKGQKARINNKKIAL